MKKILKATIINLIVALIVSVVIILSIYLFLRQEIELVVSVINTVCINEIVEEKEVIETTIDEDNKITNYPEYGTKYASITIYAIDVESDVYFGDSLEILKLGVGHSSGSYFPGEGGSIVYCGHNFDSVFGDFSELEKGDLIEINTSYGNYSYTIYEMKIVDETDLDALPIQKDEEILMVYTCYPFNNIGYATQRYVVYASLNS